ncbi:hypothetical protein Bca101_057938 [Brassica carinata]
MSRRQSLSLLKNLGRFTTQTRSVTYMPRPGDGKPRPVTLIPGDGVGPLVTNAVEQVMEAMHAPVYFEPFDVHGDMKSLPEGLLESIKKNKVCLKGGLKTPVGGGVSSLNVNLRKELDLFASLVNCFNLPGLASRHENVDIVVIRENTEGEYAGLEHEVVPGVVESLKLGSCESVCRMLDSVHGLGSCETDFRMLTDMILVKLFAECLSLSMDLVLVFVVYVNGLGSSETVCRLLVITKFCSERIAKYAFEYAYLNNRKKVTAVHKANIMKLADGLFLESCQEVAKKYPSIAYNEIIVDNCCMQLVARPEQFDVMVTPNLYGNLVANTAAGIAGGTGVMPGGNVGAEYAVFEQGASAGNVGKDTTEEQKNANPVALLLSSAMMLRHLQFPSFADRLETAVKRVIAGGKCRTEDLGGKSTTQEVVDAVISNLN